jgi:hypothetical protein
VSLWRVWAAQLRPNPYAVVALEDIHIHLFGMEGFQAADSYGSVIIVVPDPEGLYQAFASGLRSAFGKLPAAGIPRILRPRKMFGTVHGFSVVDTGGNWLRVYKLGDEESQGKAEGLAGSVLVAARLADSHGDEAQALKTLENGILRYPDAPAIDRARAYLFRAELATRLQNHNLPEASLALANAPELTADERAALAEETAQTTEIVKQLRAGE